MVLAELAVGPWTVAVGSSLTENAVALFEDELHYVRIGHDQEQLYDIGKDRWELRDMAGDSAFAGDLERMRVQAESAATRFIPRKTVEPRASAAGLGFRADSANRR